MNCPNCGKPTRVGASFCGECGATLALAAAPIATTEPPLRRPPPPPTPVVESVPVTEAADVPDVAPIYFVPPPPSGAPNGVEVVPFGGGSVEPQQAPDSTASSTFISAPPGISGPPPVPLSVGAKPSGVIGATADPSLDETRVSVRRRKGVHWRVVLADGRHVEVTDALLVGRDPAAKREYPSATLLTIDDGGHSISKTHAVFEVDSDGLWVTDLDSTNGVVITQPDGTELDLDPNVRGPIQPGADVELGDYVVQVERD